MQNAKMVILTISLSLLLATPSISSPTEREATSDSPVLRQDGRNIPRLEWYAPHGERPGTLSDYLSKRSKQPAKFANRAIAKPTATTRLSNTKAEPRIAILIDATLYPNITAQLTQYISDLTDEGYHVITETLSGGDPTSVKAWLQQQNISGYNQFVFVGDIPAAWAEVSGSVFPCDLFYMDLDGYWADLDSDNDYETHTAGTGDETPEIYVARIYAHTLNYDTEANMVNGYLEKAHDYRNRTLTQPWRGLEYIEEDWADMNVNLNLLYDENVTRYDYGYHTTAADYLAQMSLGQHFVQVCVHSFSGGHHFGTRPTESAAYAHVYVYSPTTRTARLVLGCDDGIKAWLNSNLVCTHDVHNSWNGDRYSHTTTLNEGWNQLLCKTSQEYGDFLFSAGFTDTAGQAFEDLTYQLNDPNIHGDEAQYITGWLLNGFYQDNPDYFWDYVTTNYLGVNESALNPLPGDLTGSYIWTSYDSSGPYVDLDAHSGGADYGATYAFVRVDADTAQSCQLWLGYADGARVWLNGSLVLTDNRYGEFESDMTRINVSLNAGENRLLIKVTEWMGAHGFSARFANADGTAVSGLSYDPEPAPISHIGTWLVNGPYTNPSNTTRLSQDYLGSESTVRLSAGDSAATGTWKPTAADAYPFDIGTFFDNGNWVLSADIQQYDPPVLFYNLFSCGPGRFTDSNYLAGAYIFNTTYGLITVASAKSGSMLNFQDFTAPLGEGETIGNAYKQWFQTQAPFQLWEREWYYGMVLNGDPTLRPLRKHDLNRDGNIDLNDYTVFESCLEGPATTPDSGCQRADIDGDNDVDLIDFAHFAKGLAG